MAAPESSEASAASEEPATEEENFTELASIVDELRVLAIALDSGNLIDHGRIATVVERIADRVDAVAVDLDAAYWARRRETKEAPDAQH
jgi:hypothetical protein